MSRRPALAAAALLALTSPALASPPTGPAPRFERGVLSPASPRSATTIARGFVLGSERLGAGLQPDALATRATRHLARGTLVELEQRLGELPVLGAGAAVRLDERGRVRWARSTLRALPADLARAPRLDRAAALRAAAPRPELARAADPARSRLVVWAPPGAAPRLAWQVLLAPDLGRLELWQVVVDAETGARLARRNRILTAAGHLASVFPENPTATPDLTEVALLELPDAATTLTGPDVHAVSCIDEGQCVDAGFGGLSHWCTIAPAAATNGAGNFLDYAPASEPSDPTDVFAEVAVYFHTNKAYLFFRQLVGDGFTLAGAPVTAIANLRMPGEACNAPGPAPSGSVLTPLDNAFFSAEGFLPGVDGASISLGQGALADFSYDGDVIYHELGHGLVNTLAPELGYQLSHPHGLDPTPGGLVEGLPDYLSSALTEDATLGEYVGATFDPDSGVIRDLGGSQRCPEHIAGESHFDGEIIGAALWQIRTGLAEGDRLAMDRAVVTAIDALGSESNFASFQATVVAELELALGADAASAAAAVFVERGVDDCDDFVRDLALDEEHELLYLAGFGGGTSPAAVQFRLTLASDAAELQLVAELVEGSDPSPLTLLIKPGAEPIVWGEFGDHDAPTSLDVASDGLVIAQGLGGFPAGTYHLQLASPNSSHAVEHVRFTTGGSGADAGPEVDAGDPGADGDGDGGCGCRCASARGASSTAGLALLALWFVSRRRRR